MVVERPPRFSWLDLITALLLIAVLFVAAGVCFGAPSGHLQIGNDDAERLDQRVRMLPGGFPSSAWVSSRYHATIPPDTLFIRKDLDGGGADDDTVGIVAIDVYYTGDASTSVPDKLLLTLWPAGAGLGGSADSIYIVLSGHMYSAGYWPIRVRCNRVCVNQNTSAANGKFSVIAHGER